MSPENKQRIIGIIVLTAFVALLIPFLFTNGIRKKQTVSDEIPMTEEKRQLIAQQIQDIDGITMEATPVSEEKTVAEPSSMLLPKQLEQTEVLLSVDNQNSVPKASAGVEKSEKAVSTKTQNSSFETTSKRAPVKSKIETKIAKETKKPIVVKTTTNKNAQLSKKTAAKSDAKEFWSVQVGSFSNQARVQKMVAELHKKGYQVYLQKIATSNALLTRILVGHESSKEKAGKMAKQLEATMKIKGYLVRNKK
jgi:cell division septation protein DedD